MSLHWTEERSRLFVGCPLPRSTSRAIDLWRQETLAPRPDLRLGGSLHLTLCFLGDVATARIPALVAALDTVEVPTCAVRVEEAIFLPARGPKRVVALLLADLSGRLVTLQAEAAAALASTGLYRAQKRTWLPHLTVARFRRIGQPFSLQNVNIPQFGVARMVLYSSLLEEAGAVHTPLAEFPAS